MTGETESRRNPVVLIADDDPTVRLVMREVLEQADFDVIEACDGEEALKCYEAGALDMILLDIEMPRLDGFSVCKMIREKEISRKTPICIVTGLDDGLSVDRAYHVGATDFISKPIGWPTLVHRVRYILRTSEAMNEIMGLMLALPDVIFVLDENGRMRGRPSGTGAGESNGALLIQGASFEDIFPPTENNCVRECIRRALAGTGPQIHEHTVAEGTVHLETRFVARDRHTVLAIVRDVTERRESESQIHNLAFYDRLTGLPNRQLFAKELNDIIRSARNLERVFAMLFIDLDRFKRINDTLGHSMGDELLKAVAGRLEECTRSADRLLQVDHNPYQDSRLARLGGDEFVIVLPDVGCEKSAGGIASRIIAALAQPFSCEGYKFVVTPSIGIAIYPQDGDSNDELLMNADSAMYRAKTAGRNNYKFYSGTMRTKSLQRLDMENELRRAIEEEHFELYYQPQVDISSWRIVGAEALLRWKHSERGWISPVDFIPVAEDTGLILPLGKWVLQATCQQIRLWQDSELGQLSVSANVSSQQIYSDDLVTTVTGALSDARIEATKLELEITESLLMRDTDATIDTLNALKDLGVYLSVDDFGTGYSSLSYLKRFPINKLKIDRSFVRDLHSDTDDAAICAAILAMAHSLELKVVAEGVELEEQLEFLRRHGCDQIQGYLFSRPVTVTDFEALALAHPSASEKAAS